MHLQDAQPATTNVLWLQHFIDVYQRLGTDNLHLLREIYHPQVKFADPMHELSGFSELQRYFEGLYTNLSSCDFKVTHTIVEGNQAAIYWLMTYTHNKLNGGKPVSVEGHSHLRERDGKVAYHRDYVDLGAMIYEQIPMVGKLIHLIKRRAG
ncbi:nuclear transport factor 2 family protein [Thalassotalea maritima]|uniref:nuclear transport factor 2 family protein n=1 Tax=Thalassotalea maritima TaxID=3242416 RepID=UPI00352749C6